MEAEINRELSVAEEEEDDNEEEKEEEEVEGTNGEEKDTGLRASGRDKLGSYIEDNQTESLETFEDYLGLETDTHSNSSQLSGRKRKHD